MIHKLCVTVIACLTAVVTGYAGEVLPRYKLAVGQELVYESSSDFKFENGSTLRANKTTFWVTRLNDDQSWHVVSESRHSIIHRLDEATTPMERKFLTFDAFDLYPDGRTVLLPKSNSKQTVSTSFVQLPPDEESIRNGWQQTDESGDKSSFRLNENSKPEQWVIDYEDQSISNEIYLSSSKSTIHFDVGRGLITKVESAITQGHGFKGKGLGKTELKSSENKDAGWITRLERETNLLLKAKAAVNDASKASSHGDIQKRNNAEKLLKEGYDSAQLPAIRESFEKALEDFGNSAKYIAENKAREEAVINKPAANWEIDDIDGKRHSLTDYRDKVIILDFWNRNCGACIKAMPQIKRLVDHYKDKPVVVLGMNTDSEEKDARFVSEKLGLNYPTLKGQGLPEKFGVQAFPTLVLIDQKGIVRELHVGYSPTLFDELINQIDNLLTHKK